jgi:hypothetical protein
MTETIRFEASTGDDGRRAARFGGRIRVRWPRASETMALHDDRTPGPGDAIHAPGDSGVASVA